MKRWCGDQRISSSVFDRLSKSRSSCSASAPRRLLLDCLDVSLGKLDDMSRISRDLDNHEVPQMLDDAGQELPHVLPLLQQGVDRLQQAGGVAGKKAGGEL